MQYCKALLQQSRSPQRRNILVTALHLLNANIARSAQGTHATLDNADLRREIGGAAAFVCELIDGLDLLKEILTERLQGQRGSNNPGYREFGDHNSQRVIVLAISKDIRKRVVALSLQGNVNTTS